MPLCKNRRHRDPGRMGAPFRASTTFVSISQREDIMTRGYGTGLALVGAGVALLTTFGLAQAQQPVGAVAKSQIPAAQAQAVRASKSVAPAERRLQQTPVGFNPTSMSVSTIGSVPAPEFVPAKAATIASPPTAPSRSIQQDTSPGKIPSGSSFDGKASSPQIKPDNYGSAPPYVPGGNNLYSVYHYTDRRVPSALIGVANNGFASVGYFLHTFNGTNFFYCTASLINNSILLLA